MYLLDEVKRRLTLVHHSDEIKRRFLLKLFWTKSGVESFQTYLLDKIERRLILVYHSDKTKRRFILIFFLDRVGRRLIPNVSSRQSRAGSHSSISFG